MRTKKIKDWARWNDEMVEKYHSSGTLFESKNPITRNIEIWRLKTIRKLADYKEKDVVLDLGCGEGFYLKMVTKPKEIWGIDISKVALKKARKINKGRRKVRIMFGNAEDLKNVGGEYFDKITTSEMLEHVPRPRMVMKEIYRILKKDGVLVVSVPNEKVIQKIVHFIKLFKLDRFMKAARKQETYEWHLHESDLDWLKVQIGGLFEIDKVVLIPPLLGYRLVVRLIKK